MSERPDVITEQHGKPFKSIALKVNQSHVELPQSQRSSPLAEENRLKLTRTYWQIFRYFLCSSGVCCGDMEIWNNMLSLLVEDRDLRLSSGVEL